MPQLDILSFFNQLFWFFLFYFIFYFVMIKYFLPTLARSLKLRHKIFEKLGSTVAVPQQTIDTLNITTTLLGHVNFFLKNLHDLTKIQHNEFGESILNHSKILQLRAYFVEESTRLQIIKTLLK